jgi:hypothetical protein
VPPAPIDDLAIAKTPPVVRFAAGVLLAAGVFGLLHALQLFAVVAQIRGAFGIVPPTIGASSLLLIVVAWGFSRARVWAPWLAVAAAVVLLLASVVWFWFALLNGFFTLFGFMVPGFALVAVPLAIMARKPCVETAAARKRLQAQGLELGV